MADQDSGRDVASAHAALLGGWVVPDLDYPTFRLLLIAKVMDRLTLRRLTEIGDLTYAEWRVLSRLVMAPEGLTVGRIAELAWVDRAEVSRAATALEKRKLIKRRSNPRDHRRPILSITAAGRERYGPMAAERQRFHGSLVSDLSVEERAELDRLLAKIAGRLVQTMSPAGGDSIDKPNGSLKNQQ